MRIACILASGFEDSELRIPMDQLRAAGHEVAIVGAEEGQELVGKKGKERVTATMGVDAARADDFDALLIPGGHSPDQLRNDPRFVELVKEFEKRGKLIAAVCHGPQLLLSARLVRGRRLTAWPTVQEDLRQAGAQVEDREVSLDRNWITSRKPDDLQAFVRAILEHLGQPAESPSG
jgi:protease I